MDLNYKPETEQDFSADQLEQGKAIIRAAIAKISSAFGLILLQRVTDLFLLGLCLKQAVKCKKQKELRLKDSYEHAMEYILR